MHNILNHLPAFIAGNITGAVIATCLIIAVMEFVRLIQKIAERDI